MLKVAGLVCLVAVAWGEVQGPGTGAWSHSPPAAQRDFLKQLNDNLEARVAALESQMVALQSMVTAQQSEVVAVQKEVATVEGHVVQVDGDLGNLTARYNGTVVMVHILESGLSTTVTRLNETEVRVLSLDEGLTKVNGSLAATTGRVATVETATGKDRIKLAQTSALANLTAAGLHNLTLTVVGLNTTLTEHERLLQATNTSIHNIEDTELPGVKQNVTDNLGKIKENVAALARDNGSIMRLDVIVASVQKGMTSLNTTQMEHGHQLRADNASIHHIEDEELPDVRKGLIDALLDVKDNKEKVTENHAKLEKHEKSIKKNEEAVNENLVSINNVEDHIIGMDKRLGSAFREIENNMKDIRDSEDDIDGLMKLMTNVKTEVVEFCGYQSSWNKQERVLTYEYLTLARNTVHRDEEPEELEERALPTPRPTEAAHRRIPGLSKGTGKFAAPVPGTYRVSFQVGHLETDSHGEHRTSIYIRKNGLKDETHHLMSMSKTEETDVISHEVLVDMKAEDELDIFVDEASSSLYSVTFCIALV